MSNSYGRSFLGDISSRLQRLLKFDGDAGATFDSKALPVMLVGDATLPGYGDQQGRRFILQSGVVAAGGFFYFRAVRDVIITQIRFTQDLAANSTQEWRQIALGTAPGVAPAIGGLFMDRSGSLNDRPPMEFYNGAVATAGTIIQLTTCLVASPLTGVYVTCCDQPFCLAAGGAMGFFNNGAGSNPRYEVWGRTL